MRLEDATEVLRIGYTNLCTHLTDCYLSATEQFSCTFHTAFAQEIIGRHACQLAHLTVKIGTAYTKLSRYNINVQIGITHTGMDDTFQLATETLIIFADIRRLTLLSVSV